MGVLETLKATFGSALVAASCMGAALPAQAAAAAAVLRYEIKALAVPAGADALIASDLNDLGAVTGWVRNEGNPTPYGAGFVWRNGRTTLLVGVNNAGQVIGTGLLAGPGGSAFRSFVATPVPEFGTAALMFAGLGVVAWATRQRRGRQALAGPDLSGPRSQPAGPA